MFMPISAAPGISKSISDYASGKTFAFTASGAAGRMAQGRYSEGDHIRFVANFPEKLGGWTQIPGFSPSPPSIPRSMQSWRDNSGNPRVAIATESDLYSWDGSTQIDITPLRTISAGTLGANPFTTTGGSSTVAVADSAARLVNGDWVEFTGVTAFNNITINGWYQISSFVSGTGFNITVKGQANASSAGGGAAVTFNYPRVNLTNPFTTTSGSPTVQVTHNNHGALNGDHVVFSGASAVGGLTLNGEFVVSSVATNTYNITATSNASSGATGGGTVSVIYEIHLGNISQSLPVAYGQGVFGTGPYGFQIFNTASAQPGWTLARYGSQLLSCPIGGTIYVYDPSQGGRSYPLLNAPTAVRSMFVTPERFVIALGTSVSAMQIAWADQNDYTVWTTLPTNTAQTGRTLEGGTVFVGGKPIRDGVSIINSDKAVFQLNYSGDTFVYNSPEASDNASLISPWAITVYGENAYWMSSSEFWIWDGTVQPLPSDDIRDYVFRNINLNYASKCWAGVLRAKKEIWFNYPSQSSTEIDSYVIYHTDQQCWSKGSWANLLGSGPRTAWNDADLFSYPFACDSNGNLYQHEYGTDDNGRPLNAFVTYAPVDVSNGDANVDIFGFIPDFSRLTQNALLTINTRSFPQDTNIVSAPYLLTSNDTAPYIDLRIDGKMIGFQVDSNVLGGDFRLGLNRVNVQPGGARI